MIEFNTKKLITGAIACAIVVGAVAFAERVPTVSNMLAAPPPKSAHVRSASSTASVSVKDIATSASAIININTASEASLTTLSGIGATKAAAIIRFRSENGPFHRIEDITQVHGIGKAIYENIRDRITVGDVAPAPQAPNNPIATSTPSLPSAPEPRVSLRILIEAVMTGTAGNAQQQYIELFNPNAQAANLTGWIIKKKTSTGSVSTFVAASRFKEKIIPASGYLLIASPGYSGAAAADLVWPASYSLASAANSLILYGAEGALVDSVSWSEIPTGKSYARVPPENDTFSLAEPTPHNSSH